MCPNILYWIVHVLGVDLYARNAADKSECALVQESAMLKYCFLILSCYIQSQCQIYWRTANHSFSTPPPPPPPFDRITLSAELLFEKKLNIDHVRKATERFQSHSWKCENVLTNVHVQFQSLLTSGIDENFEMCSDTHPKKAQNISNGCRFVDTGFFFAFGLCIFDGYCGQLILISNDNHSSLNEHIYYLDGAVISIELPTYNLYKVVEAKKKAAR